MSKKEKPKNTDLPVYNEKNFENTDAELGLNYGDGRYFNKESGGILTGELKLDTTVGVAHLELQSGNEGDLKINNSQQGLYFNRYRIKDDYIASNEIRLGENSQCIIDNGNIKLSSGSNGIINIGNKFIMDIANGRMSIGSRASTEDSLYIDGNLLVEQTITCSSIVCPSFSPFVAGSIVLYPSINIPTGWLLCDGGSYDKIQYFSLWNVIQYTFGGSRDSFKVPDLINRFPRGATSNIATTGGKSTATLTEANLPSHSHTYDIYKADGYFRRTANATSQYYFWASVYNNFTEYFYPNNGDVLPTESSIPTRLLPDTVSQGRPYAFLYDRRLLYDALKREYSITYEYAFLGDKVNTGDVGNTNFFSIQNPYIKYCFIIKT